MPGTGNCWSPARSPDGTVWLSVDLTDFLPRSGLARFDRSVAGEDPGPSPSGMRGGPGMSSGTIRTFVAAREASVAAQLGGQRAPASNAGTRGRGGRGPMGPPDGGPDGGMAEAVLSAFDRDRDGWLTRAEWRTGASRWFDLWDTEVSDSLTEDLLRSGIEHDLLPRGPRGGFPEPPPGQGGGRSRRP
jgi:hypothetical protein